MKIIRVLLIGLALVAVHSLPASAAIKSSSLNCGKDECVEVWQFTCPTSNLVAVQIADADGVDDTLMVSVVATAPAGIKGHADADTSTTDGFFSSGAFLNTVNNANISGFALVTTLSNTGATKYNLSIVCANKAGDLKDPTTFARVQDQ